LNRANEARARLKKRLIATIDALVLSAPWCVRIVNTRIERGRRRAEVAAVAVAIHVLPSWMLVGKRATVGLRRRRKRFNENRMNISSCEGD